MRNFVTAVTAVALSATPALAATNAAAPLSVAAARAATPAAKSNRLAAPGAIIGLILAVVIVAGGIYIAVDDEDSDSN